VLEIKSDSTQLVGVKSKVDVALERVCCNLCGADDAGKLLSSADPLTDGGIDFTLVKCRKCDLVYVNPRPFPEDIHKFYPDDFFSYQMEAMVPEDPSLRQRLVAYLANSSAEQRVGTVTKLLAPTRDFQVLDIGCGKGAFLYALQNKLDCKVAGLDFDEASVDYGRRVLGIEVSQGGSAELEHLGEKFDLVTMWHYLEHDFDPAATLHSVNRILKPGQHLLLEVPNADSMENSVFGKHSYLYDMPRHLYNFSPDTITRYLENAGFAIESIEFPHFSGGWIGSVQGLLFRGKVFRDLESHVYTFFLLSILCLPVDLLFGLLKKGSVMTVLARKVTPA
jgi:SAM-dependent methyltransferase